MPGQLEMAVPSCWHARAAAGRRLALHGDGPSVDALAVLLALLDRGPPVAAGVIVAPGVRNGSHSAPSWDRVRSSTGCAG